MSYMRIMLAKRNNAAELRKLDHLSPAAVRSPNLNLERTRIVRRAMRVNDDIQMYNEQKALERLLKNTLVIQLGPPGTCPVHPNGCPDVHEGPTTKQ